MRIASLRLEREGFRHGFSLRTGGVSEAPFDTLNFARNVGDAPAAVEENHRRFAEACGYDVRRLYETNQVHGRVVQCIGADDDPIATRAFDADALRSDVPGMAVAIRVADCVPILLGNRRTGAVAAVHAGWKGLVCGVVESALEVFVNQDRQTSDWIAFVGPHIRPCCFEVADDVAAQLAGASSAKAPVDRSRVAPHVDLAAIAVAQLRARGVTDIEDSGGCTHCEPERFFSFRRDGARSGRHLAVIEARN